MLPPGAVVVPRSRFAPVKTCGDLLVLRSDCYEIAEDATVAARVSHLPLIRLDDSHYKCEAVVNVQRL